MTISLWITGVGAGGSPQASQKILVPPTPTQKDCQEKRKECESACEKTHEACLAEATIACEEAWQAHLTECQGTYGGQIAKLQTQAMGLMQPVQEAMLAIQHAEALKLVLAQRINELERISTKEIMITCWRAQYKDDLTIGDEVEIARTPAGRNVITDAELLELTDNCLNDARALPPTHLFVNAAISPGFETWAPTWRTGKVVAVNAETLQVEVHPGTLTGTMGTDVSVKAIDCTPPQAYFNGDVEQSEQKVTDARDALVEAQDALTEVLLDRTDCIDGWDETWVNGRYTDLCAACDVAWGNWLADCMALEAKPVDECIEEHKVSLATCYTAAMATAKAEQRAGIAACQAQFAEAIQDAQDLIQEKTDDLQAVLADRYKPATPLVLELPVAYCSISSYQVNDDVLIGFPERDASKGAMAVWESAAVYGWASEVRQCVVPVKLTYHAANEDDTDGYQITDGQSNFEKLEVMVNEGDNGPIVIAVPIQYFLGWSDGNTHNPRQDFAVTEEIDVVAMFGGDGGGTWNPQAPPCFKFSEWRGCRPKYSVIDMDATIAQGPLPYSSGGQVVLEFYEAVLEANNGYIDWATFSSMLECQYGLIYFDDYATYRIIYKPMRTYWMRFPGDLEDNFPEIEQPASTYEQAMSFLKGNFYLNPAGERIINPMVLGLKYWDEDRNVHILTYADACKVIEQEELQ